MIDPDWDGPSRAKQLADVWSFMFDGRLHTLREIAKATKHPEASVSARLRDFRKERHGRHTVERYRATPSKIYLYRLVPRKEVD